MFRYPDEEKVKSILRPFEGILLRIHHRAWDRWMNSPHRSTCLFSRTLSTTVYDFIAQEAALQLDELPEVRRIDQPESVKYLFADTVLMRFKRGNKAGLGQNIETGAELAFTDPRLPFMNLPRVLKVEACWFPNATRTKIDRIAIVARDVKTRIWSFDLGTEPATAMLPMDLPIVPLSPPASRTPLVTLRGSTVDRANDESK